MYEPCELVIAGSSPARPDNSFFRLLVYLQRLLVLASPKMPFAMTSAKPSFREPFLSALGATQSALMWGRTSKVSCRVLRGRRCWSLPTRRKYLARPGAFRRYARRRVSGLVFFKALQPFSQIFDINLDPRKSEVDFAECDV